MDHLPDYHVVSLKYNVKESGEVTWNVTEPLIFKTNIVKFTLMSKELICELKEHCATEKEALTIVDPIIKAWELESDLKGNFGVFRLEFVDSEIIDRNPRPPGSVRFTPKSGMVTMVGFDAILHVTKCRYPDPPTTFSITPDVESLWIHYKRYLDGKEPLLAMAYYCFTAVKSNTGSIDATSKKYKINKNVLKKLSELSSTKGDVRNARKHYGNNMQALSPQEMEWINQVIKKIIIRVGDTREISTLPEITMTDFPRI